MFLKSRMAIVELLGVVNLEWKLRFYKEVKYKFFIGIFLRKCKSLNLPKTILRTVVSLALLKTVTNKKAE